jgi:hypothetical protein
MSEKSLRKLIALLGLVQLAAGCWIMFATESFGETIASFDGFNAHDLRDFATFYLALGVVLLVAAVRPAWRFPVLTLATLEYAFHTIVHAVDAGDSDPGWLGPVEFVALLIATALFAWLARASAARKGVRASS